MKTRIFAWQKKRAKKLAHLVSIALLINVSPFHYSYLIASQPTTADLLKNDYHADDLQELITAQEPLFCVGPAAKKLFLALSALAPQSQKTPGLKECYQRITQGRTLIKQKDIQKAQAEMLAIAAQVGSSKLTQSILHNLKTVIENADSAEISISKLKKNNRYSKPVTCEVSMCQDAQLSGKATHMEQTLKLEQAFKSMNHNPSKMISGIIELAELENLHLQTLEQLNGLIPSRTITAVGALIVGSDQTIAGNQTINGNSSIAGTLSITGATTLSGANTFVGNSVEQDSFDIFGRSQAHQDFTVTGSTSLVGDASIGGTLNVNSDSTLSGDATVGGTLGVTGNTTLLGSNTFVGSSVEQGFFDVFGSSFAHQDFTVTGSTSLTNTVLIGSSRMFGQSASVTSIDTYPGATTVLTVNFVNLAGTSGPLFKGAHVKLQCFVAGTTIDNENIVSYYDGNIYVGPGTTPDDTCSFFSIDNTYTSFGGGNLTSFSSSIAGSDPLAAEITLSSSSALTNQSVMIFYEITSDNLASVS